jgi:hypothetical protein
MFGEKGCELVKGDVVQSVVQINMPRARNDVEFLRFGRQLVGVLAELTRSDPYRISTLLPPNSLTYCPMLASFPLPNSILVGLKNVKSRMVSP